ncbi:hypothetical protein E4U42_005706 [Claviceps africana]|uniref:Large ribosomal subunit protein mL53 n=1 Tax=Claviceps africana TaxID=83212 RepID=A0A8K0J389_9HYPO|nr:hypothetical protein E4U42_005706 [Claviceps africana]
MSRPIVEHVTYSRESLNDTLGTKVPFAGKAQASQSQSHAAIRSLPRFSRSLSDRTSPRASHEKMITKFMTEVTARFNPFAACAKPARLFLTYMPPNARANGTSIHTTLLPRGATESSSLRVKFKQPRQHPAEDGKELEFDCAKTNIKSVIEELDRHSRQLQKAADLTD